jgi:hypothetical protein
MLGYIKLAPNPFLISINDGGEIIAFAHNSSFFMQTVLLKPLGWDDDMPVPARSNVVIDSALTTTGTKAPSRIRRRERGEYRIEY